MTKQKLELTWIGKEKRAKLEPRILVEGMRSRITPSTVLPAPTYSTTD